MLEIRNIVKQYANHRALDGVSFHVKKGSLFGILGPNGAGKTSLIRIINQITGPDSGEILFDGEPLSPKHISRIGYLPEERGLYKKMEIGEQMLYLAQLKGLSKAEATKRIKHWFEKLEMQSWWNKKVEDLSKGMQQKVQFVATVVHEPDLIILDEPFSGFDPVNVNIIKEEIQGLNRAGATILFSTHRMESVEELCDSIVLINKSKKILEGGVREIKNSRKSHQYHVDFRSQADSPADSPAPVQSIPGLYTVMEQSRLSDHWQARIQLDTEVTVNQLLMQLISQVEIIELREIIPSIHDIFVQEVTQKNLSHA
jgi:ABC-2 type transport system ATP-binding protein